MYTSHVTIRRSVAATLAASSLLCSADVYGKPSAKSATENLAWWDALRACVNGNDFTLDNASRKLYELETGKSAPEPDPVFDCQRKAGSGVVVSHVKTLDGTIAWRALEMPGRTVETDDWVFLPGRRAVVTIEGTMTQSKPGTWIEFALLGAVQHDYSLDRKSSPDPARFLEAVRVEQGVLPHGGDRVHFRIGPIEVRADARGKAAITFIPARCQSGDGDESKSGARPETWTVCHIEAGTTVTFRTPN